eukprot:gene29250-38751_t
MCYTQQQGNGLNCRADSGVHTGMMLKVDTLRDLLIVEKTRIIFSSGYIAPIRLSDVVEVVSGDKADASAQSPERWEQISRIPRCDDQLSDRDVAAHPVHDRVGHSLRGHCILS